MQTFKFWGSYISENPESDKERKEYLLSRQLSEIVDEVIPEIENDGPYIIYLNTETKKGDPPGIGAKNLLIDTLDMEFGIGPLAEYVVDNRIRLDLSENDWKDLMYNYQELVLKEYMDTFKLSIDEVELCQKVEMSGDDGLNRTTTVWVQNKGKENK